MFTSGESCYVFLCACLRRCRDEAHEVPKAFYKKCAEAGILGAACGDWPTTFAGPSPLENWDAIHAQIMIDELCRCASGGLVWGIVGGLGIGLPLVCRTLERIGGGINVRSTLGRGTTVTITLPLTVSGTQS